ncbi:MAG: DUF4145 domain-containing protein [Desulfosalsimonadaceae bacterium]
MEINKSNKNMPETHKLPKIRIFCNECLREMTHIILSSVQRKGCHDVNPDFTILWENTYQVIECQECHNVTFRIRHWNDEIQSSHDKKDYQDSYYPPIVSRPKPPWFGKLDEKFQDILQEVYIALDANTRFLAAFGARTALDMLIVDKIGDTGSFENKLKKLETDGYIDSTERELLDAITEAGNAAAHRGYAPDEKLLESVIDILESLFDKFCIKPERDKELLKKARELKSKIPKRK